MKKILAIWFFIVIGYANAGDTIQKELQITWNKDVSKRVCTVNFKGKPIICNPNDLECIVLQNTCLATTELPLDTVDDALLKSSIRVEAVVIHGMLEFAIKKNILKPKQLGNFWHILYAAVANDDLRKHGFGTLVHWSEVGNVLLDITYDTIIKIGINSLSHQELQKLNVFHKNTSDDTIRKALEWMLTLAKNDFKAYLAYRKFDLVDMISSGVIDNSLLLADITVETLGAYSQFIKSSTSLILSQKRAKMLDLYIEKTKLYCKESSKIRKDSILNDFIKKCKQIKLSYVNIYTVNPVANGSFIKSKNSDLSSQCDIYKREIKEFDRNKADILLSYIINQDLPKFEKFISDYLPETSYDRAMLLYTHRNALNPLSVALYGEVYQEYVLRMLHYGFELSDFGLNTFDNPAVDITGQTLVTVLSKVTKKLYNYNYNNSEILKQNKITRGKVATLINDIFRLENDYVNKNKFNKRSVSIEEKIPARINKGWTHDALILNVLKVVHGNMVGNSDMPNFRKNDYASKFEMMIMLVRAMDIVECGHVNCSEKELLGAQ